MTKLFFSLSLLISSLLHLQAQSFPAAQGWITKADRSELLAPHKYQVSTAASSLPSITVTEDSSFQIIDGFGYALTGGSAQHLMQMSAPARKAIIKELFGTGPNDIGISYLRLSIGASDLNDRVFSYDDLPDGETDVDMKHFDLGQDKKDVVPIMKEILKVAPSIKILGSPWSPPVWMKNNKDTRGGRMMPEYYPAYAKYFVKYVQEMKKEGITIDAITVQNEPLHPGNNPSLLMPAPDMADFVRDHLGPAFARAGIKTKIIVYDHNADRPDYPIRILDDPGARKYVDGSGFHLYGGSIEALSDVHEAYPQKNIYFTEQMVVQRPDAPEMNVAQQVRRLIVGATRNWSKNVLLWNLAADSLNRPFTDRGGCSMCQGAITIDDDRVSRNLAYYVAAHASKFVRPGAVRIGSTELDGLSNVAFRNRDGKKVLLVANTSGSAKDFVIRYKNRIFSANLDKGAVATYVW